MNQTEQETKSGGTLKFILQYVNHKVKLQLECQSLSLPLSRPVLDQVTCYRQNKCLYPCPAKFYVET